VFQVTHYIIIQHEKLLWSTSFIFTSGKCEFLRFLLSHTKLMPVVLTLQLHCMIVSGRTRTSAQVLIICVSRLFKYICIVAYSPWHFMEMSQFEWFSSNTDYNVYVIVSYIMTCNVISQVWNSLRYLVLLFLLLYYISVCKQHFFPQHFWKNAYTILDLYFLHIFCTIVYLYSVSIFYFSYEGSNFSMHC